MKLFLQALILLMVISTVSICAIKPNMHKTVMVYNSDYALIPEEVAVVEEKPIPIMEMPMQAETKKDKIETSTVVVPKNKNTVSVQKAVTKQAQTTVNPVKSKTKTIQNPQIKTEQYESKKAESVVKESKKKIDNVTENTVKPYETPKILTVQEEEIAWNKWRSALQNKIMTDVKLPILPNGTTFKFSFTVDKYGRVSNVQTYSTNPTYTPYAIEYIAPVIRSYQGKSILSFPTGSTRISTNVIGGWKISTNEKYSTPQDYNDVEKVIR